MDRRLSYIDANPDILDILLNGRFALEGIAKVAEAVFGQNAVVAGFTCAPTSPASMTVNVGPGQVYQMAALESASISALQADTHQVLKQGLAREITPLTLVAPTTVGTAVNVLVEVAYVDDKTTTQQVFNYYNAANPDIPLTGVGGNNLPQTSVIKGVAQVQTKYGIPATAGSQTTPPPDPGFAPLFVVTLTQGQTAISGNIGVAPGAPFVADVLQNIPAGVQANKYTYVKDTGAVNALVVAPLPALASRPEGTELLVLPKFTTTTTTPTIYDGLGTVAIFKRDGTAPAAGDLQAGIRVRLIFDGTAYRFAGNALSDGGSGTGGALTKLATFTRTIVAATGSYSVPWPSGAVFCDVRAVAPGAGGGYGASSSTSASGGSAGSTLLARLLHVTGQEAITGTLGAPGAGSGATGTPGSAAGTSTLTYNGVTRTFTGAPGGLSSSTAGANSPAQGGITGTASTDSVFVGGQGRPGYAVSSTVMSGQGGDAPFGGTGGVGGGGIPSAGNFPGGGGGGSGAGTASGANGGGGQFIFDFYGA